MFGNKHHLLKEPFVLCVVAHGMIIGTTCVARSAAGTIPMSVTIARDFAASGTVIRMINVIPLILNREKECVSCIFKNIAKR